MNVIFIGFIHSGKTTYGKELSEKLGRPFIDTDESIETLFEQDHQKRMSCRDIHRQYGNEAFRALEKKAVLQLLKVKESVIAVGGGSIADSENVEVLKQTGRLVYLKAPKNVLKKRFLEDVPSYADPSNPLDTFESLYESYRKIYEKIADLEIKVK